MWRILNTENNSAALIVGHSYKCSSVCVKIVAHLERLLELKTLRLSVLNMTFGIKLQH